jgi:hypothetical protein
MRRYEESKTKAREGKRVVDQVELKQTKRDDDERIIN